MQTNIRHQTIVIKHLMSKHWKRLLTIDTRERGAKTLRMEMSHQQTPYPRIGLKTILSTKGWATSSLDQMRGLYHEVEALQMVLPITWTLQRSTLSTHRRFRAHRFSTITSRRSRLMMDLLQSTTWSYSKKQARPTVKDNNSLLNKLRTSPNNRHNNPNSELIILRDSVEWKRNNKSRRV